MDTWIVSTVIYLGKDMHVEQINGLSRQRTKRQRFLRQSVSPSCVEHTASIIAGIDSVLRVFDFTSRAPN